MFLAHFKGTIPGGHVAKLSFDVPSQNTSVPYAKIWSRIYAFCLDSMIVYFVIWSLLRLLPETRAAAWENHFLAWGSVGWWSLFLLYRGLLSSRHFQGQTFG